jgi:hypothetical protein
MVWIPNLPLSIIMSCLGDIQFWYKCVTLTTMILLDTMIGMKGITCAYPEIKMGETKD